MNTRGLYIKKFLYLKLYRRIAFKALVRTYSQMSLEGTAYILNTVSKVYSQYKSKMTDLDKACDRLLLFPEQENSVCRCSRWRLSTFIVFRDLPGMISSYVSSINWPSCHQLTLLAGLPSKKIKKREGWDSFIFEFASGWVEKEFSIFNVLKFKLPHCIFKTSKMKI